jgi:general L-amino acid transport system permease protein
LAEVDRLTMTKPAISDPASRSFSVGVYLFMGVTYFAFCVAMSRYSRCA